MRFVGHQQMVVLPEHSGFKGDTWLSNDGAKIVPVLPRLIGRIAAQWRAICIQHIALRQALLPNGNGYAAKAHAQKIEGRDPGTRWREHHAGTHAISRGWPGGRAVPVGRAHTHLDPFKHQIPHAVAEFDAAIFKFGKWAVVRLGRIARQLGVGGQRTVF